MENTKQSQGGNKRAQSLTEGQRKEIASNAAKARWKNDANLPKAEYKGEITIGDIKIPCAVLDDGTRIVSERGIRNVLGASGGSSYARKKVSAEGGAELPVFLAQKQLEPFVYEVFKAAPISPVKYKNGRNVLQGYPAVLLPKICEVWLKARELGALKIQQLGIAAKAETLMRGLAHIGIIALVDEATGYQAVRSRQALQDILEKFIAKELQPWVKTFPDEFYENLFRLRGWQYKPMNAKKPGAVAYYTVNLIYERLAPGVLDELKKKAPKNANGKRTHKLFQNLTPDIGHPKLKEHISNVLVLQKVNDDWDAFMKMMDKALPKFCDGKQLRLFTRKFDEKLDIIIPG